ncbi:hypothetical protein [Tessaracoccus caeni]|uniref:hypothetical protein n=1 Tax=Tessaracoccus caeni TaxID=3031239 RepID=UPI0023DA7D42|nr:hypothetical protein [Tessaracoccus caeni]MDF1489609.1 hypothetical protein [Tessaracoccus caeni]
MSERLSPSDYIVAIATTDDWCQPGRVSELIAHGRSHRGPSPDHDPGDGAAHIELDFYDESGRLLRPILAIDNELVGFAVCGEPEPDAVEARIVGIVDHIFGLYAAQSKEVPASVLASRPEPGDLRALMAWFARTGDHDDEAHPSSWFHNVMHSLFG